MNETFDLVKIYNDDLRAQVDSEAKNRRYANHASSIGDVCLRRLVYQRLKPEAATKHSAATKAIFKYGHECESTTKKILMSLDIKVYEFPATKAWEEFNLTGTPDGLIDLRSICQACRGKDDDCECFKYKDERAIIEVKSMNQHIFEKTHRLEDLEEGYKRRYLYQLAIYLWLSELRYGLFIFFNKSTRELKTIFMDRDDPYVIDLADKALKTAELVEHYVKINKPNDVDEMDFPDKINDQHECGEGWCQFHFECKPVLSYGSSPEVRIDKDLFFLLKLREDNKFYHSAFGKADKSAKMYFDLKPDEVHGSWIISDGKDSFHVTATRGARSVTKKITFVKGENK